MGFDRLFQFEFYNDDINQGKETVANIKCYTTGIDKGFPAKIKDKFEQIQIFKSFNRHAKKAKVEVEEEEEIFSAADETGISENAPLIVGINKDKEEGSGPAVMLNQVQLVNVG